LNGWRGHWPYGGLTWIVGEVKWDGRMGKIVRERFGGMVAI